MENIIKSKDKNKGEDGYFEVITQKNDLENIKFDKEFFDNYDKYIEELFYTQFSGITDSGIKREEYILYSILRSRIVTNRWEYNKETNDVQMISKEVSEYILSDYIKQYTYRKFRELASKNNLYIEILGSEPIMYNQLIIDKINNRILKDNRFRYVVTLYTKEKYKSMFNEEIDYFISMYFNCFEEASEIGLDENIVMQNIYQSITSIVDRYSQLIQDTNVLDLMGVYIDYDKKKVKVREKNKSF